jgi:carbamate kinase
LVDAGAPEFDRPDKPVGPVYTEHDARRLAATRGWHIARTSAGGWRRAVASPRPVAVIEAPAVARLLDDGCCVIAGGGGGIPLADGPGGLGTVDGVVDKDYTAALLATAVGAKRLIVLTDVPGAALSFGNAEQRYLRELTVDQARHHLEQGEFAPGSMKPKVEACLEFLARGGESAVIAATTDAAAAFVDRAGTRLIG